MRQHRDYPVCQINAGAALPRLTVQRAALLHIIRNVSNMHAEMPDTLSLIVGERNSVVQILGILAVDCHHIHCAQILSARTVRLGYRLCHALRLIENTLRKLQRKIMRVHDGQNIDARIVAMTNDLLYLSLRIFHLASVICQLHQHLMSVYRTLRPFLRDKNITRNLLVIRHHKSVISALLIGTYHLGNSALTDFGDNALTSLSGLAGQNADLHGIPVHCSADVIFRNKDILRASLNFHKPETLRSSGKCADKLDTLRLLILSAFGTLYFPIRLQVQKNLLKLLPILLCHLHNDRDFFYFHRHIVPVADQIVNLLPALLI